MGFQVLVHRRVCDPYLHEAPLDQAELDLWLAAWQRLALYEAPLDEENAVAVYWSAAARRLGLPFLAGIYGGGLRLMQPQHLDALDAELDQLEAHWQQGRLPGVSRPGDCTESLRRHMLQRLGYLRQAIRIARREGGVLTVC